MTINDKYIATVQQISEQQKQINALQKDLIQLRELHDAWRSKYFEMKAQRDALMSEFCSDLSE